MQRVILFYFLFINLLTFLIYSYDKFISRYGKKRRVSEKELHTFSIIGGFLGASLAMALFHHKIAKSSFLIKHIVILLLWIVAIAYYFTQIDVINFLR
ncbi:MULTISPECIES: DUF1294 domain-containing protein [Sulfurimonas]|uniref:DUF1294 domain-containing protein n=1 Tax=Sulfurimonas TaxID=202746 RepID=UPI00126470B3|nr:DUF1294 domain-containing protein [Sulfurimonas indica]